MDEHPGWFVCRFSWWVSRALVNDCFTGGLRPKFTAPISRVRDAPLHLLTEDAKQVIFKRLTALDVGIRVGGVCASFRRYGIMPSMSPNLLQLL